MSERFLNFIDGKHVEAGSGRFIEVFNPALGEKYAVVAASNKSDVDRAVDAAKAAFPKWAALTSRERGAWLRKLAAGIEAKLETFAAAETCNTGKPISLSRGVDIPRSVHNFDFFADAATQFASESHAEPGVAINYTLRQALGVVGCISPWNLPLYLFTWKIAPALACGNTVVAKPSEVTPHTAWLLSNVCAEVGFPKGVLNIVHGTGPDCGSAIVDHPSIAAVSFTGSTAVGQAIAQSTGKSLKKVSLELGGKNALLVFADCDWQKTMDTVVRASFANQGQICLAASRILVESSVYERFRSEFVARTQKLRQGDPTNTQTEQGAVVSKAHWEKILACLDRAGTEGAKVLCGGKAATLDGKLSKGWFVQPTVLEGVAMNSRTAQEEIFGPVVTLHPFDSEESAIALANESAYGLATSLWTRDSARILRISERLRSGIVWVNCWMLRDLRTPFGGVKNSGVGREGGWEAMRFFTEPKNVCIAQ